MKAWKHHKLCFKLSSSIKTCMTQLEKQVSVRWRQGCRDIGSLPSIWRALSEQQCHWGTLSAPTVLLCYLCLMHCSYGVDIEDFFQFRNLSIFWRMEEYIWKIRCQLLSLETIFLTDFLHFSSTLVAGKAI